MGNSHPARAGTQSPATPSRTPRGSPLKGGRSTPSALASPVGDVRGEKPSIMIPLSPPPPSPAVSPASSVARSSISEASSADSYFGDESFFQSIQVGTAVRSSRDGNVLNAVGVITGRPCVLKLSTLEVLGMDTSPKQPFSQLAALRIQLVEATSEGTATVVWERQTPELAVGPGVLPLFQQPSYLIPHATSRQSLVLSLIIGDALWAQACFLMSDVRSTVHRTRLVCRSANYPGHSGPRDGAHSSRPSTPKTSTPRTPTRRTPTRHSVASPALPPTPHTPSHHPPLPLAEQQQACAVTGGLDFFTHLSAASTWMEAWSDTAKELQRRLVVLADRLYFFADANDADPSSYDLDRITDVVEDEFHHGRRTLIVKLRPPVVETVDEGAGQCEKEWTIAPPCDREFLHWFQLLRKKIYETEFGASAAAVASPGVGE